MQHYNDQNIEYPRQDMEENEANNLFYILTSLLVIAYIIYGVYLWIR